MQGKYMIVDKALLPSYFEKVALVKELLDEGKAADVSEAVKMVGISRSTFYKYRDMVRDISTGFIGRMTDEAYASSTASMTALKNSAGQDCPRESS